MNQITPRQIFTVASHEQVLDIWRENRIRNAKVLHLDFRCDLRGLLINRTTQRAYRIRDGFSEVDDGNFLTHAILEGIVNKIRWVHDEPGGRRDDWKTVKYESDASALVHRAALSMQKNQGIPIQYEVITNADFCGINRGEILDIDWDFFASLQYQYESVQPRIDRFLANDFSYIPEQTFVCYSSGYSHATRGKFNRFVNELADRFKAEVVDVPQPVCFQSESLFKSALQPISHPARQIYQSTCQALRKHGIY